MGSRKRKIKGKGAVKQKSTSKNKFSKSQTPEQEITSQKNVPPKQQDISKRRQWLFRIIAATVAPVIFIFFAEFLLWATGYGYSANAIIKYRVNDTDIYCNNPKFGWTFFPRNISRESNEFVIETTKQPQTYRIFILGASAAYGEPDPAYSFGRILRILLEEQYDGFNFEVINLGMSAINSHAVLKIAKDCARYQPDLFVVYLGNNEVVGPYGAGTVFTPLARSLSAIRAGIAVKSTRLGQLLQQSLSYIRPQKNNLRTWQGMAMFLENQVQFDSPDLDYVYQHYERNLTDICQAGRNAEANVILCNVSCNLKDSPPFASQHKPGFTKAEEKEWSDLYQKAVSLEPEGDYAEAINNYLNAAQIDDHFADLHFRMGRCYQAIGDFTNAGNSYVKARDLDTLRFRPDTKINNIIRSVAEGKAQEGIYFVDTISAFENNSPNKIPGKELFYEHVHFTFQGNYLLALTVYDQIEKILPQHITTAKNGLPIPSEQDCVDYLAYTGWDQRRVVKKVLTDFISKPPFTNQLYHEHRVKEIEEWIESLSKYVLPEGLRESAAIYSRAIGKNPTDWNLIFRYAEFLMEGLEDFDEAIAQYRIVIKHMPFYVAYNNLGTLLFNKGYVDEAIDIYNKGLERKVSGEGLHYNLALALEKKQDVKGTIKHCTESLEINPKFNVLVYHLLARAYLNLEDYDKAIQILRESLEYFPNDVNSHLGLGTLYMDTGKRDQAIEELNIVLRLQPDHEIARQLLERQYGITR